MTTAGLFDALPLSAPDIAGRDAAIERVSTALDDWLDDALSVIRALCARGGAFTSDDVWGALTIKPPEPRALGGAMKRAVAEGLIRKTGEYRQSRQRTNHARPVAVWVPA